MYDWETTASIINPMVTLIYNSYLQMEAPAQAPKAHIYNYPPHTQCRFLSQSVERLCLLGCRLNTYCYGDGTQELSEETKMR